MHYKRILTIQDISCVGQCSMTVALPILSAMGHETCILPTALLSTHTGGFGKPVVAHFEDALGDMWRHWKEQGIRFDAILTGYLGSVAAIDVVSELLDEMLAPGGIAIVDPAMGDHGRLYAGFDETYARAMKGLCAKADLIIPNITEAAILTGQPYREALDEAYVEGLLSYPGDMVLTGVGFEEGKTGVMMKTHGKQSYYAHDRIGKGYHGTGDMFAAVFTGALVQGRGAEASAKLAADFVCKSIEHTIDDPAHWYGVKFETVLPWLIEQMKESFR